MPSSVVENLYLLNMQKRCLKVYRASLEEAAIRSKQGRKIGENLNYFIPGRNPYEQDEIEEL